MPSNGQGKHTEQVMSVHDDRVLQIRLVLKGRDGTTPADFLDLFRCGDDLSRYIAQHEVAALLEELEVPSAERLAAIQKIRSLGKRLPSPAEVQSVEKGSWEVSLDICALVLVFLLKEYIHPIFQQAWAESDLRERLLGFLRRDVFRRAKRQAETKAIDTPSYGNLRVAKVEETAQDTQRPELVVYLERREITEVRFNDPSLLEDFLRELKK